MSRPGHADIGHGRADPIERRARSALIREEQRRLQRRRSIVGIDPHEHVAWEMLCEVYACHLEGRQVSVSGVCRVNGIRQTTGLRTLSKLVASGLVTRHPDVRDRRRAWVELTAGGHQKLARFFNADRDWSALTIREQCLSGLDSLLARIEAAAAERHGLFFAAVAPAVMAQELQ